MFLDKTENVISLKLDCTRKGPKVHVFILQGNHVQNHSFKSQKNTLVCCNRRLKIMTIGGDFNLHS